MNKISNVCTWSVRAKAVDYSRNCDDVTISSAHTNWRPHIVYYSWSRCVYLGAKTGNNIEIHSDVSEHRFCLMCVSKWMFVCWCLCLEAAVPPWVGYNEEETIQQQILALSAVSKNLIHYITVSTQSLSCPFWLNVCSLNVGQEKFLAWPSGWCPVPLRHGADVSSGCSDAGGRPAPQPHALWPGSKTVSTLLVCVCVVACSVHSVYFTLRVCFCRRVNQAQFNWPVESMSLNWCWCVCVWQCEGGGVLEELFLPGVSGEAVGSADSAGSPAAAAAAGRWGQGGHWGRLPNRSDSELCLLTTAEIIHMVILCVDVLVCIHPKHPDHCWGCTDGKTPEILYV